MRSFKQAIYLFVLCALGWVSNLAGEYKLTNGDVLRGEPASFNDDGLVVRLQVGGFSPRIGWGKFTQESLKELAQNPQAKKYVEPFIEIPLEVKQEKRKRKEIVVKDPDRVARPAGKQAFFATLTNPPSIAILIVLYLANLFAAFEIAVFRNRSVPLVCGVSALLPVIGPILFLAMPSGDEPVSELAATAAPPPETVGAETKIPGMAPAGLGLASHEKAGKADAAHSEVYKRGDTTFNRRFFETKFPGFFRVVPSEAEKDLVLVIKGAKSEYVAKRISRISTSEMHLQLLRGGSEVSVSFGEIMEVQVRHKDAKA